MKPAKIHWLRRSKYRRWNGAATRKPEPRKQDRRAKPGTFYVVVFFPRIHGIPSAEICHHNLGTLAASKAAAISKFMDQIAQGEKWANYQRAGHRVRRVRITDLGDAA